VSNFLGIPRYDLHRVAPIELSWAKQLATCIVGESTGMFIVRVDWIIWVEFAIDPFGNKGLELRGVITSSTIGSMSKLNEGWARLNRSLMKERPTIFNMCK
jgi:hypothetical protein